jgi:hypothetical protein
LSTIGEVGCPGQLDSLALGLYRLRDQGRWTEAAALEQAKCAAFCEQNGVLDVPNLMQSRTIGASALPRGAQTRAGRSRTQGRWIRRTTGDPWGQV